MRQASATSVTSPFAAAMGVDALKGKNVPVILEEVQSLPQSDDVSHNFNYAAADVLADAVNARIPVSATHGTVVDRYRDLG